MPKLNGFKKTNIYIKIMSVLAIVFPFFFSLQASAQTSPASSSPSATLQETKGDGRYTKDGRKFETLKPEDLEGLSRKEKMDYAIWIQTKNQVEQKGLQQDEVKNQVEQKGLQQDEVKNQEIAGKRQDVQAKNQVEQKGLQQDEAKLITEYREYIKVFRDLHDRKGFPGFNMSLYTKMKNELKGVMISKKPPEILPQLEPLRSILMPVDYPAPRK